MSLAEFVIYVSMMPLLNPSGGIWPIDMSYIRSRSLSKVTIKEVGKNVAWYLHNFKLGVEVSSGDEAVLHSANRVLRKRHGDGSLAILTVDFSNDFNMVDRLAFLHEVGVKCPFIALWVDFLYGEAVRLYLGVDVCYIR